MFKLFERADWWLRFRTQAAINFTGRKFGATRKTWAVNGTVGYVAITGVALARNFNWLAAIMCTLAVLLVVAFSWVMQYTMEESEVGPDINWIQWKGWRFIHLFFLPINLLLLTAPPYNIISNATMMGNWACLASVLWAVTCNEAPPREEKYKKVAFSS